MRLREGEKVATLAPVVGSDDEADIAARGPELEPPDAEAVVDDPPD